MRNNRLKDTQLAIQSDHSRISTENIERLNKLLSITRYNVISSFREPTPIPKPMSIRQRAARNQYRNTMQQQQHCAFAFLAAQCQSKRSKHL